MNSPPILIWIAAASFYLYQFILRVSPSIMLPQLQEHFAIGASEVGTLSAVALYTYAAAQVPAGIVTDHLGARRVILMALPCCLGGVQIFIHSKALWQAQLGRFLIGLGSAPSFLCLSKVSAEWFPARLRATYFGLAMATGTFGALNGSAPLGTLVRLWGWQTSLNLLSGLGVLVWIFGYLFLRDPVKATSRRRTAYSWFSELHEQLRSFRSQLLRSPVLWFCALAALGLYSAVSVVADLWGVAFLVDTYGMDQAQASRVISSLYVGLCLGSLMISMLSDRIGQRKLLVVLSFVGLTVSLPLFFHPQGTPPIIWTVSLLCLIGFFSGAEMLCFSLAVDHHPIKFTGSVSGFVNAVTMLGGALIQQRVGLTLDSHWDGHFDAGGAHGYLPTEFSNALNWVWYTVMLAAAFALLLPNRSHAQAQSLNL